MRTFAPAILGLALYLGAAQAAADPVMLDAVLTTTDSISLNFKDDTRRFLTLLQREGTAAGAGRFEGAKVVEYGMHDVTGGEAAEATGFLEVITTGGDVAYFRWSLRAFFVDGTDGKPGLVNGGHWELAGGTGHFATLRGVGTMAIEFPSKTERRYILEGEIASAP